MNPAAYFKALLENMNELLLVCDSGYIITLANRKASDLFGCPREDITGRKIFEFFPGENSQELQSKIKFSLQSRRAGGFEIPLRDTEGNKITLKAKVSPFTGDEASGGFIFLAQDISGLERVEADFKKLRERFHTSVEAIPDCFGIYRSVRDESGRIVDFLVEFVNASTCSHHNLTKDQHVGRSLLELLPYHRKLGLFDDFCQVVETGRPLMGEKLLYDDNNKHLIARALDIKTVRLDDGVAVYWRDITEQKRAEEELRALTLVDDLTGLYNRRGFITLAQQQLKIARRMSRDMLLLFADVDGLKGINDTLGHHEGDIALIETARILKETFREPDIIARIGGDEFAVLVIEASRAGAGSLARRFKENLKSYNDAANRRYVLSLSIGVASYNPEKPCLINELLERADKLMYQEKRRKGMS